MENEPIASESIPIPRRTDVPSVQDGDEGMELIFDPLWLLQVFYRHHTAAILIFFTVTFISLFFFLKEPPQYNAKARLKIEPKRHIFSFEQLTNFELFSAEFYATQVKLLQSRSLIREIINTQIGVNEFLTQMQSNYNIFRSIFGGTSSANSPPPYVADSISTTTTEIEIMAIDLYMKHFTVSPDRVAPQIFSLSFTAPDPKLAAFLANYHTQLYIKKNTDSNVLYTDEYINNLKKQIKSLDELINTKNEVILNYKKDHGFFQIQGISSFDPIQDIDDRLSRVREQLDNSNDTLTAAQSSYEFLFEPDQVGNIDAIREDVIISDSLDKLRARRNELLQNWAEIKDKYLEKHPQYISIKSKIESVEQSIEKEISMHVTRAKNAFDEAFATTTKLTKDEQDLIKEKYRRDQEWNQLNNLEKTKEQMNNQRAKYFNDLQNAESSRDTQQQTQNRTYAIVDNADVPTKPINRQWFRILLLSFAAGISLSITGVLLIELQDKKIRTPQHIEQATGISVMGCIPFFKSSSLSPVEGRLSQHETHTPAGESFIALRTRFLFSEMISQTQTVLITSAMKGEGKSTVTVNLAISLCTSGKRVVIIDCDLRKPKMHRFFGESVEPGLFDIINDADSIENVLFETDVPGLYIIPAGSFSASPSEVLSSPSFDEIIETLKEEFDFVLLDSPSVLATPDPTIMAPRVDMTLLVIRSGKVVQDDILSALDHIKQTGGYVYATILNGVPSVERSAYSRYGYGYTHQYNPENNAQTS